ncbi:MAG: hypothetical protein CMN73_15565 [Sphingomonas sp.]|nr:hypothetical protein [Sphingomonas sp.]
MAFAAPRVDWHQLRSGLKRRAPGLALALVVELLLALLLLTIAPKIFVPMNDKTLSVFDVSAEGEAPAASEASETASSDRPQPAKPQPQQRPTEQRQPQPQSQPQPVRQAPSDMPLPDFIPMSRADMAQVDDSMRRPTQQPATPARPSRTYGPVDPGVPGARADSEVVGTAPDGSPLYGAEWYERPSRQMMRGYLSTLQAPAYALISCRTAPRYRVEDCQLEAEGPKGSGMGQAVLAMAWEFRVRPPRKGGREQVGSWVRIRIDLTRDTVLSGSGR